ncbi:hypothetical protein V501_00981 [Pseudogymnoascus sp. VKM F-4519 (FW-2642)]|nr:hypothetical protein V501_00981 [Pseudogymnoascus sp. VKM F-4519 (FW-2642)]
MRSRTHQFRTTRREMEAAFRQAEEKERREIKEANEHREPNPWLRRVGWAAHLAGLDRGEIREWVEMPDDDEPELQTVVGQAALFEVHRKEVTEEARMPFDSWMDITTLNAEDYTSKYSAVAKLARMMVVHEGYEQRQEEVKRKTEANERQENRLTAEEIGEAARSYFHYIWRLTYQFMTMAYDGWDPMLMSAIDVSVHDDGP